MEADTYDHHSSTGKIHTQVRFRVWIKLATLTSSIRAFNMVSPAEPDVVLILGKMYLPKNRWDVFAKENQTIEY